VNDISDAARLKLGRAQKHLEEIEELLAGFDQIRPHAVAHSVEGKPKKHFYRLWLADQPNLIAPDPQLAIVMGDFLNNVRSALDYMMIAIAPRSRRKKLLYFPIFSEDFREECATSGPKLERLRDARTHWDSWTKGIDPLAKAYLLDIQPFSHPPDASSGLTIDDNVFLMLVRLNNADKHRELVSFASGFSLSRVLVTDEGVTTEYLPALPLDQHAGKDGAPIFVSEREVQVNAEGTIAVVVRGRKKRTYQVPRAPRMILDWVRGTVVPDLEPFAL
jgi:hypothetical protein